MTIPIITAGFIIIMIPPSNIEFHKFSGLLIADNENPIE